MSEYGDYSDKIFHDDDRNSYRASQEYSGEYIDFNPHDGFNFSRLANPEYQEEYLHDKEQHKDTDCTLTGKGKY